jgi:hypothetical protein
MDHNQCFFVAFSFWNSQRHYRVRNGPTVGTFLLSVLDNGVTSNEFWTLVGAADDLSWIVFHYAGAAKTVGQVRSTNTTRTMMMMLMYGQQGYPTPYTCIAQAFPRIPMAPPGSSYGLPRNENFLATLSGFHISCLLALFGWTIMYSRWKSPQYR